jgi:alpha-1,3-rhamnosyltransferase
MAQKLVEDCKQRFFRFEYVNRENIGLSATLNQALSWARGTYFSALASDDVAFPEKIELLVNALEEKGHTYAAAFGNALFIDNKGHEICIGFGKDGRVSYNASSNSYNNFMDLTTTNRQINYRGEDFGAYRTLIVNNYLPAMSNVVRTAAISEAGGWTVGNAIEDWEMWMKLSKKYKFIYVDMSVAFYRWHDNNSINIISHKLNLSALSLRTEEKTYCAENCLLPVWRKAYVSLLVSILLDKRIAWHEKRAVLDFSEISRSSLYLVSYLTKLLVGKVARMMTNEK